MSQLLTPQEVADILKVKKNTVYEMIKRGDIHGFKIGKQLRIDAKEIEAYNVKHTLRSNVNPATSFLARNKFLYWGNKPVSYTHLDVYKRQGIICSERKTNRLFTERNPYGMKMS